MSENFTGTQEARIELETPVFKDWTIKLPAYFEDKNISLCFIIADNSKKENAKIFIIEHLKHDPKIEFLQSKEQRIRIIPVQTTKEQISKILEFGADTKNSIVLLDQKGQPILEKNMFLKTAPKSVRLNFMDAESWQNKGILLSTPYDLIKEYAVLFERSTDPSWKKMADIIDPDKKIRQIKDFKTTDPFTMEKFNEYMMEENERKDKRTRDGQRTEDYRFLETDDLKTKTKEMIREIFRHSQIKEKEKIITLLEEALEKPEDFESSKKQIDWWMKKEEKIYNKELEAYEEAKRKSERVETYPRNGEFFSDRSISYKKSLLKNLFDPKMGPFEILKTRQKNPEAHKDFTEFYKELPAPLKMLVLRPEFFLGTQKYNLLGQNVEARSLSLKYFVKKFEQEKNPKNLKFYLIPDGPLAKGEYLKARTRQMAKSDPEKFEYLKERQNYLIKTFERAKDLTKDSTLYSPFIEDLKRGAQAIESAQQTKSYKKRKEEHALS